MKPIAALSFVLLLAATHAQAQHAPAHKKHITHKQTASAMPMAQAALPPASLQTPPPAAPIARDTPFPDVPKDHWAYQAVETLRKAGVVHGYPAGTPRAK